MWGILGFGERWQEEIVAGAPLEAVIASRLDVWYHLEKLRKEHPRFSADNRNGARSYSKAYQEFRDAVDARFEELVQEMMAGTNPAAYQRLDQRFATGCC